MLAVLTPAQLAHAMFPLGDTTKAGVRAEAAERGLTVADKPDSHDICFIADGDTRRFLGERLGTAPGPIVDAASGAVLGEHDGAHGYTVGQRSGLRPATGRRPTAGPGTCCRSRRSPTRSPWARSRRSTWSRCVGERAVWLTGPREVDVPGAAARARHAHRRRR